MPLMAGLLQHHVHEACAPQAAAPGGIAADIAARVGDEIGRTEAARRGGCCPAEFRRGRIIRHRDAGIGIGEAAGPHSRHAGVPARQPRDVPVMTTEGNMR